MKTYLTLIIGVLLLSGCDEIRVTQSKENAQFGFEISGDKLFRVNRKSGEITVYWLEAGKLKRSSNHSPRLTGNSYEDENGKRIYYIGNMKLSHSVIAAANAIVSQRKGDSREDEQRFQLHFIRDTVLRTSDVSGFVMAYVHADGKLESVPEERLKLTAGMLLRDENEQHVVYVGNGVLDDSNDQVNKAIMCEYRLDGI